MPAHTHHLQTQMASRLWLRLNGGELLAVIAALAILTSLLMPVYQALQAAEQNSGGVATSPAIPACYGPSGFPEIAKLYLWESNPNNCNSDCECNERVISSIRRAINGC